MNPLYKEVVWIMWVLARVEALRTFLKAALSYLLIVALSAANLVLFADAYAPGTLNAALACSTEAAGFNALSRGQREKLATATEEEAAAARSRYPCFDWRKSPGR